MFFFFKQKTAYEVRISDWSSDVCSSGLPESEPKKPLDRIATFAGPPRLFPMSAVAKAMKNSPPPVTTSAEPKIRKPIRSDATVRIGTPMMLSEIGRASCRERVSQYVYISVVAVSFKKKDHKTTRNGNAKNEIKNNVLATK